MVSQSIFGVLFSGCVWRINTHTGCASDPLRKSEIGGEHIERACEDTMRRCRSNNQPADGLMRWHEEVASLSQSGRVVHTGKHAHLPGDRKTKYESIKPRAGGRQTRGGGEQEAGKR